MGNDPISSPLRHALVPVKLDALAQKLSDNPVLDTQGPTFTRHQIERFLEQFDGSIDGWKDGSLSPPEQRLAAEMMQGVVRSGLGWEVVAQSIETLVGTDQMVSDAPSEGALEEGPGVAAAVETFPKAPEPSNAEPAKGHWVTSP